MQKSVEDILRIVAERHGVTLDTAKAIWINEWKYAAFRMRCGKRGNYGTFRFVYLPNFLRLYTSERKVAKLFAIMTYKNKRSKEEISKWRENKDKKE